MAYLTLSVIAFVLYWAYTISVFRVFGIPESYSNTFYLYNEKRKGLGILFPIMSALFVFLLIPSWFHISDKILPNWTWISFFSGIGLLLVCASPFFKEMTRDTGKPLLDLIYKSFHGQGLIHTIGALLAMICSVVWISLTPYWWYSIVWLVIMLVCGLSTWTLKNSLTFWVEFLIYNMIASFIIIYNIILL